MASTQMQPHMEKPLIGCPGITDPLTPREID
jgi:hypothetical protein